jgi:SAM-dependent methyltransferase
LITDRCAESYAKSIGEHARGRVIDVGCGPVPLYGMYRPKAETITCVDWGNSLHDVNFCDGFFDLNKTWDLPSDSFDTVIATDVLEHLYAPATFFSEAARICAPGGKLILGVPFFYWIHEAPHDHLRHTEFSLRRFCEVNDLAVQELYAIGGAPEILTDILFKVLPLRGSIGRAAYWLARKALSIGMVRSMSMKTRKKFPMSYVLVASKDTVKSPKL